MRLLVAAEPREFDGFVARCGAVERLELPVWWARVGVWKDEQVIVVANGAGFARAAAAVDAVQAVTRAVAIVSVGFCGALDPALRVGDIVVADEVNSQPADVVVANKRYRTGKVASIDHVAGTAMEKAALFGAGSIAVEMEAGGVGSRARAYGVPFYCIRAVTDVAEETFANDFNRVLREDGRYDLVRLVAGAMRQPARRFPELLRLQRRCGIAARRLGEFLDACQF